MKSTFAFLTFMAALVHSFALPSASQACSTHGLVHAATLDSFYVDALHADGRFKFWFGVDTVIVPPDAAMACAAAVGLGSLELAAPPGLNVLDARIGVVNTLTGSTSELPFFDFAPNTASASLYEVGGGPSAAPDLQPQSAGATWFGFSAQVEPFVIPSLGPNEELQMQFLLDVALVDLPLALRAQFAAGAGDSAGLPDFTSDHPVRYFAPSDNLLSIPVPEPTSFVLAAMAVFLVFFPMGRRTRSLANRATRRSGVSARTPLAVLRNPNRQKGCNFSELARHQSEGSQMHR